MQHARLHIHHAHGHLLPSFIKTNQPKRANVSPFTVKLYQEHPDATIKFVCLSCILLFDAKTELKIHVDELHFVL